MKLVVDANIIISALIRDSITRQLIFLSRIDFFIPDILLEEVLKYKGLIKKKAKLSEEGFTELLALIMKYVVVAPKERYALFKVEAEKVMKKIDRKDAPYIALALAIKAEGIWSEDKDFKKQERVKSFTTQELVKVIRKY